MRNHTIFDKENIDIAWCPGCGNFGILEALKQALSELNIKPTDLVVVSGIGQAPKTPHYFWTNMFNGLHGRSLPVAAGVKAANPNLLVIVEGGDGDMYGEGGNHFLHAIRRNMNIVHLVHNNMVYGLTKGQASPTSEVGFKTPVQVDGVISEPLNPIAVAIAQDASFVARAYSADLDKTKEMIKAAIKHEGYALIDIFQPCVTFNTVNTYKWFKEHTYYLAAEHNSLDRNQAFAKAIEKDKLPLGIFYQRQGEPFEKKQRIYKSSLDPLYKRSHDLNKLKKIVERY
jgi:2-oxoglutarate/2-oxoacid ferredoxin oxidoreductase subunit beta